MATMDRALFFLSCLWLVICPRFVHSDIYNYVLGKQPNIDKAQDAERLLHELQNELKPWQGNNPILGNPKKLIDSTIQRNPKNPDNMFKIFIGSNPEGSSKMDIPQYPFLENQMNPSFLKWLQQNFRQQNPESQSTIQITQYPLSDNPSLLKWLQQIVREPTKNSDSPSLLDLILQMNQGNQAEKYPNWPQYFLTLKNPFISNSPFDQNSIGSPFLNPNQKIQINPDNTLKIILDPFPEMQIRQYPLLENQMNPSLFKWLQQIVREPKENSESQSLLNFILQILKSREENEMYPNWSQYNQKSSILSLKWLQQILRQPRESPESVSLLKFILQVLKSREENQIYPNWPQPDHQGAQVPLILQVPLNPLLENQLNLKLLKWFQQILMHPRENPESQRLVEITLQILFGREENPIWPEDNLTRPILSFKWILQILGQPRESPESLRLLKFILQTLRRLEEYQMYPKWSQPNQQGPRIPIILQIPEIPILEYQLNLRLLKWFQQILKHPRENPESQSLVYLILQIVKRPEENPTEKNPHWPEDKPISPILSLKWILQILGQPRESPESLRLLKFILRTLRRLEEYQMYPKWSQPNQQGPRIPIILQIPENPILEYQLNLRLLKWFQQILKHPRENPESQSLVYLILQIVKRPEENPTEKNPHWPEDKPISPILSLKWILQILEHTRESPESLRLLKFILQTLRRLEEYQMYPKWSQPNHQGPRIPIILQISQNSILEYQLNLRLLKWFQQILKHPRENPESQSLVFLILQILKRPEENSIWPDDKPISPTSPFLRLKWILQILGQPRESPESLRLLKFILHTLRSLEEYQIYLKWSQPNQQGPRIPIILKVPQNPILEYQLNLRLLKWFQQILMHPRENPESQRLVEITLQILFGREKIQ